MLYGHLINVAFISSKCVIDIHWEKQDIYENML